jgi:crotonobetainyl-CoA:carnitine CoA-transferase CaiB-like acyl-CoA transferase
VTSIDTSPHNRYPCKPGGPNDYVYVFTSPANPEHWQRLLKVIGHEDLTEDPRLLRARGLNPNPSICGKMNHIQWLFFLPSRNSEQTLS